MLGITQIHQLPGNDIAVVEPVAANESQQAAAEPPARESLERGERPEMELADQILAVAEVGDDFFNPANALPLRIHHTAPDEQLETALGGSHLRLREFG
jgi:hypothetical protein